MYLIKGDIDSKFAIYSGSDDYLTYVIIGGMLSIFSVSMMMNVSRALITEWREGTLEALLLSPSSRSGYFLGNAVQQLYRSGAELLVVLFFSIFGRTSTPLCSLHICPRGNFAVFTIVLCDGAGARKHYALYKGHLHCAKYSIYTNCSTVWISVSKAILA